MWDQNMFFPGTGLALPMPFSWLNGLSIHMHVHQCLTLLCTCTLGLITILHMCHGYFWWKWLPLLFFLDPTCCQKPFSPLPTPIQLWPKPHILRYLKKYKGRLMPFSKWSNEKSRDHPWPRSTPYDGCGSLAPASLEQGFTHILWSQVPWTGLRPLWLRHFETSR